MATRIERLERMLAMAKSAGLVEEIADLEAEIEESTAVPKEDLRAIIRRELSGGREEQSREMVHQQEERGVVPFPVGPTGGGGIERYGDESPAEALERWRHQEQRDPNGTYGMGGATAGGVFGDGAIVMPDYDPAAHARGGPVMQAEAARVQTEVMLKVLDRLEAAERREEARLAGPRTGRRLPGRRRG